MWYFNMVYFFSFLLIIAVFIWINKIITFMSLDMRWLWLVAFNKKADKFIYLATIIISCLMLTLHWLIRLKIL